MSIPGLPPRTILLSSVHRESASTRPCVIETTVAAFLPGPGLAWIYSRPSTLLEFQIDVAWKELGRTPLGAGDEIGETPSLGMQFWSIKMVSKSLYGYLVRVFEHRFLL